MPARSFSQLSRVWARALLLFCMIIGVVQSVEWPKRKLAEEIKTQPGFNQKLMGYLRRGIYHPYSVPKHSGVLLFFHNSTGTQLQYRSTDVKRVRYEKSFPLSTQSFAVDHLNSDIVIVASPNFGEVSRNNKDAPDHEEQLNARGVVYDSKDKIIVWLKGEPGESGVVFSTINEQDDTASVVEEFGFDPTECKDADHAVGVRVDELKMIAMLIICDNNLILIKMSTPISSDGVQVKAIRVAVGFYHVTSITAGLREGTLDVFISHSDGDHLCEVEKVVINPTQSEESKMVLKREVVFDCNKESAYYHIRGVAYYGGYLYISSFTPNGLFNISNCIGRIPVEHTVNQKPLNVEQLNIIVSKKNTELIAPVLFSPGPLHLKEQDSDSLLYWLDLLSGRISRVYLKDGVVDQTKTVWIEPGYGVQCPSSVGLLPPSLTRRKDKLPELYYTDFGMSSIWKDTLVPAEEATEPLFLQESDGLPTASLIDPKERMLYWATSEKKSVFSYSLDSFEIIAQMTYQSDLKMTPARFNSIAYLPSTQRIYVTDSFPANKRILSWAKADSFGAVSEAQEVWRGAGDFDFIPNSVVGDPDFRILYVSCANSPIIYAMYLNPVVKVQSGNSTLKNTTDEDLTRGSMAFSNIMEELNQELFVGDRGDQLNRDVLDTEEADGERAKEENDEPPVENEKGKIVIHTFYNGSKRAEVQPIRQMWLNKGFLNWIEIRPVNKTLIETTVFYKRLPVTEEPQKHWDEYSAFVFTSLVNKNLVVTAQMYDVYQGLLPPNIWQLVGLTSSALVTAVVASVGIYICWSCRSPKVFGEEDEKDRLNPPVDQDEESYQSASALMVSTKE